MFRNKVLLSKAGLKLTRFLTRLWGPLVTFVQSYLISSLFQTLAQTSFEQYYI